MTALYHDECNALSAIATRAETTGLKLEAVGMQKMADEMYLISASIISVKKMILEKQQAEIERELKAAERGSMDMIMGVIKIMEHTQKGNKTPDGKLLDELESIKWKFREGKE